MSLNVELLESSFEQIKPCAGDFATSFYENLFSANPEAKPLFASTDLAEQKKKLVASLVLVVENLRKPDVLEGALKGLGARHVQYGALPEHYPLVGSAILTTFEQYLGEDWTDEVKQAWVEAYGAITELMLSGADYDSKVVELDSVAATEPETTVAESETIDETEPEVAEDTPTEAVAEPETTEEVSTEPEESGLKVSLLENSFEQIKPRAGEFAASFYENLFRMYPAAQPLFTNTDLAEQQKKLVASLVLVVENLRKPDALENPLKGLGARHVQYGALPEHYPLVGNALLTTFEQYLGDDWTDEVKQAWVEAYGAITELMLSGADYDSAVVELDSVAATEPEATVAESETIDETEPEVAEETPTEAEPETTEESGLKVSLLENSFEQIKPRAGEFAASFYENLFRMYPAAQPLFTNTDLAEQQKKLVASLVLVVENLRKPDALENPLKGLGARHVQYGALPEHYPLVGNALLTTFEQYLGDDWTPQVKQAWVEAYGAITELMLSGADYDSAVVELDSVAAAEAETAEPVVAEETPTETTQESDTIDETEPETAQETPTEAVAEPETAEESGLKVSLLENSFEQIKPRAGEFAASFYENLFRMYPAAQPLFTNTDLAEQQKKLVASLVLVVENLRKPDALENPLKGLGARHVQYGALPEHYPLVGNALLTTFEQYLGDDWTPQVKQAWVEAYGAITELMLSGADYDSKVVELDSVAAAEAETAEPVVALETPTETAQEPETIDETEPEVAQETLTEAVAEPETTEEVSTEPEESGLKVSLLENSFEQIKPRAGEFAASFYENLFRMYPAAEPLFTNTDLGEQQKKLVASLVLVVENLRKPDALESPLKGLGARHVQYGALPEHYPLVGNALLTTFEQYLGDDWTPQVKQAWVEAYGAITELMLSGADYDSAVVELDSVAATEAEVNETPTQTPDTPIAQTVTEPVVAEFNSTAPTQTVPKTPTVAEVGLPKPIEQPPSSMNFALFSGVFGVLGTLATILLLLA